MNLAAYVGGRDNNFNLIRATAASAVLVSHSYVLVGLVEPLRRTLGMTPGSIAVDVFFLTSGFLVTASLVQRRSVVEFAWARFLRIFPALAAVMMLTVFVLGPILTTVPLLDYFSNLTTYVYLARNTFLFAGVSYFLPGVFAHNPYPEAVNGSLWTMPHEVRMYAILALGWLIAGRRFRFAVAVSTCLAAAVLISAVVLELSLGQFLLQFLHLFFFFFVGSTYYIFRDHIPVLSKLALALFVITIGSAFVDPHVFNVVYLFAVPYLILWAAYVPAGLFRRYNRLGDYSYGIYIFAFPVQQVLVALFSIRSPVILLISSFPVTVLLAVISWYGIEKRALALKTRIRPATLLSWNQIFAKF